MSPKGPRKTPLGAPRSAGAARTTKAAAPSAAGHALPPLDAPEKEPERVTLEAGQSSFSFWGWSARVELAAPVLLRYITEPPHGDPLYALQVDGRTVGRAETPALFYANNVHFSVNRKLLGLIGYGRAGALLYVVHLTEFRVWSREGLARIHCVRDDAVVAELWPPGETTYGPREILALPEPSTWTAADELPDATFPALAWPHYRL